MHNKYAMQHAKTRLFDICHKSTFKYIFIKFINFNFKTNNKMCFYIKKLHDKISNLKYPQNHLPSSHTRFKIPFITISFLTFYFPFISLLQ